MIEKNLLSLLLIIITIYTTVCSGKKSNKLVRGTDVDIRSYPFQVSLQYLSHHICSGTIVSKFYILTVASCVTLDNNVFLGNLRVLSGTEDRYNSQGFGQIHDVSLIIYHPQYKKRSFFYNDAALLKLEKPIVFSPTCRSIRFSSLYFRGIKPVVMTSWGDGFFLLSLPTRYLSKADLTVELKETCNDIFQEFIFSLHSSQSCATLINKQQMITEGDGGSPITIDDELIGIVSVHGSYIPHALIFTKTYKIKQWIQEDMDKY